jgi:ribosomal protein S18 acetylase RimI-like enzyme
MSLVQAHRGHIPTVVRLIATCTHTMREHGIDQWDDLYPNEEIITRDVDSGSLYVLEQDDRCLAAVSLNQEQDAAYQTVHWFGGEPALVVHRLCVDPAHQGNGIGNRVMAFAEAHAKQQFYVSIRLDAYTGNPRAVRLYERRGYRKAGQVYFPRRTLPFFCFEKILRESTV